MSGGQWAADAAVLYEERADHFAATGNDLGEMMNRGEAARHRGIAKTMSATAEASVSAIAAPDPFDVNGTRYPGQPGVGGG